MSQAARERSQISVAEIAQRARAASRSLARLSGEARNEILTRAAQALEDASARILDANEKDRRAAEAAVREGTLSTSMLARLRVDQGGVAEMAERVRGVARLPDPLGRVLAATELDEGLVLCKETCALGVVGIIFESRPDVIPQVASLALKSANAVILKGGAEAAHTNEALVAIWRECLREFPGVPAEAIWLLEGREQATELLSCERDVDLIIPRGSRELVEFVARNSRVPVLGHGEGICHVYVDRAADMGKALAVAYDAKVQYPAVCNAAETLLVHREIARDFLPRMARRMGEAGVELRGDAQTAAILSEAGIQIVPATESDWATEYSALILSVKVAEDLDAAIEHINRFGSRHTEAIVTEDAAAAERFMNEVDAAGVYQNASTRFADGFRYGFGAELGVSTNKLHARGPMGLDGLVTYKFKLRGDGHTVTEYAGGNKKFTHRDISDMRGRESGSRKAPRS
ncbi:MAG TPA: glutamate-5-semialdehyde dehydrogenase [Candidatus Acidoferrales bacterium]|nr:glutamate-5-semialdehyde dehydrogenase [Candidatus Acidoferrales bacterium]